jgi:hypothetical protein
MQAGTIAVGPLISGEPVSRVVTVARSPQVVVARHGPRIVPDATLVDDPRSTSSSSAAGSSTRSPQKLS